MIVNGAVIADVSLGETPVSDPHDAARAWQRFIAAALAASNFVGAHNSQAYILEITGSGTRALNIYTDEPYQDNFPGLDGVLVNKTHNDFKGLVMAGAKTVLPILYIIQANHAALVQDKGETITWTYDTDNGIFSFTNGSVSAVKLLIVVLAWNEANYPAAITPVLV